MPPGTIERRPSLACAVACVAFALTGACVRAPETVTAARAPDAVRRPDGVHVDPPFALPPPSLRAEAVEGVVALREPLSDDAMLAVARAYVAAFVREDLESLGRLLTSDATALGAKSRASKLALLETFRTRMRNYDYSRLAGASVLDEARLERRAFEEFDPDDRARPTEMQPGDVLLRVPVATPAMGGEPLFGSVIVFVLRAEDGETRIAAVAEDGPP
jgi:hypothetical protein